MYNFELLSNISSIYSILYTHQMFNTHSIYTQIDKWTTMFIHVVTKPGINFTT